VNADGWDRSGKSGDLRRAAADMQGTPEALPGPAEIVDTLVSLAAQPSVLGDTN
jgi:hypothetical protein